MKKFNRLKFDHAPPESVFIRCTHTLSLCFSFFCRPASAILTYNLSCRAWALPDVPYWLRVNGTSLSPHPGMCASEAEELHKGVVCGVSISRFQSSGSDGHLPDPAPVEGD